jgi:hypothetical protein
MNLYGVALGWSEVLLNVWKSEWSVSQLDLFGEFWPT